MPSAHVQCPTWQVTVPRSKDGRQTRSTRQRKGNPENAGRLSSLSSPAVCSRSVNERHTGASCHPKLKIARSNTWRPQTKQQQMGRRGSRPKRHVLQYISRCKPSVVAVPNDSAWWKQAASCWVSLAFGEKRAWVNSHEDLRPAISLMGCSPLETHHPEDLWWGQARTCPFFCDWFHGPELGTAENGNMFTEPITWVSVVTDRPMITVLCFTGSCRNVSWCVRHETGWHKFLTNNLFMIENCNQNCFLVAELPSGFRIPHKLSSSMQMKITVDVNRDGSLVNKLDPTSSHVQIISNNGMETVHRHL